MERKSLIILPDVNTLKNIRKELGEDPKRLEKQIELFKQWLRCESHLPKDVDDNFIKNFVRQCKYDLEKAKKKFELYLMGRKKFMAYYPEKYVNEDYFEKNSIHRMLFVCPNLTPDGYRVLIVRFLEDPDEFDFGRTVQYGQQAVDMLLFDDVSAGNIIVYDLKNLTAPQLGKFRIKQMLDLINLVYNTAPFRVKAIHILNMAPVAEIILVAFKKVLSEKMAKRIIVHRDPKELSKSIPLHVLPEDYGGTSLSAEELADRMKAFFLHDKIWIEKSESLKLEGCPPPNKHTLYSFEDFEMEGSFRQLSID